MLSLSKAHQYINKLQTLEPVVVLLEKANGLIEIPEGCTMISKTSLAEAWFF